MTKKLPEEFYEIAAQVEAVIPKGKRILLAGLPPLPKCSKCHKILLKCVCEDTDLEK